MSRQERALRTRRRILEAAASVFAERGYASAGMAEILEAAEMTKGALYFHFPSKEALAKAVVEEQFQLDEVIWRPVSGGVEDCPAAYPPAGPMQAMIDMSHQLGRQLQEDPVTRGAIRLAIEQGSFAEPDPTPYRTWIANVRHLLSEARDAGSLRPGHDIDTLAEVLVGSFTGIQLVAHVLSGRSELHRALTEYWRATLPGLVKEEHLPQLDPAGPKKS
ncbi:ScbR family autoregulator-binding transcription factor [Streptomyces coacervatus]|uniref:ScbR family autoregulator-binding transcription factor n=1 Tax=Streptomyces coacervatus TaxID=647381 RepID=A0ABP7IRB4_9ACTN|nr:ScbR family autoregulator-binding transcription factor [Streptomyces coacervatus]MDF2266805.1 ScbR family autoregulator-binding transcription factor [Streptomyces coacervatus]